MPKWVSKAYRVEFSLDAIADALAIDKTTATELFQDGRVSGQFTWDWVRAIYHLKFLEDPSQKFSIGMQPQHGPPFQGTVRTLTKGGVSFLPSIDRGGKRSGTPEQQWEAVQNALRGLRHLFVVDVSLFPVVRFLCLPAEVLRQALSDTDGGLAGKETIGYAAFYAWLTDGRNRDAVPWERVSITAAPARFTLQPTLMDEEADE